jgi:hypothetical protein
VLRVWPGFEQHAGAIGQEKNNNKKAIMPMLKEP